MKIDSSIAELRRHAPQTDWLVQDVSEWSVGMHIRHCVLVMLVVCRGLAESNTSSPRRKWHPGRALIFSTKWIPRGRGKASNRVVPERRQPEKELLDALDEAQTAVSETGGLDAGRWIMHPRLGPLSRDEAFEFLLIHNRHHLKIIRDIQQAVPSTPTK